MRPLIAWEIVPHSVSMKCKTTLITDTPYTTLGAVQEQVVHPVMYISRVLTLGEQEYLQALMKPVVVFWPVKGLHKNLFNIDFVISTDHKCSANGYN